MGRRKGTAVCGVHVEGFFSIPQPEHQQVEKYSKIWQNGLAIIVLLKAPTLLPRLLPSCIRFHILFKYTFISWGCLWCFPVAQAVLAIHFSKLSMLALSSSPLLPLAQHSIKSTFIGSWEKSNSLPFFPSWEADPEFVLSNVLGAAERVTRKVLLLEEIITLHAYIFKTCTFSMLLALQCIIHVTCREIHAKLIIQMLSVQKTYYSSWQKYASNLYAIKSSHSRTSYNLSCFVKKMVI